ncbi:MAG: hypothetical protein E5W40_19070 [Mesorhizobium sp.]|nr:MAG: hypothetical protein E5W40_19070 [Mesorhizobium sp.]
MRSFSRLEARLRDGFGGVRGCLRIHAGVDVGAEHVSLAPETHGAGRVQLLRGPESALRLRVIERPRPAQALVEIGLRQRVSGGDKVGMAA